MVRRRTRRTPNQPPSRDQKANCEDKLKRVGPRQGSLGRKGDGRVLAANPGETVVAQPSAVRSARRRFCCRSQTGRPP